MRCIIIATIIWSLLTSYSFSQDRITSPEDQSAHVYTKEDVNSVLERAKTDPSVLWEIRNAPLDLTREALQHLWFSGEHALERRESARRRGEEQQWVEQEHKVHRDPDTDVKIFPTARDVLLSYPELESYLSAKLQARTQAISKAVNDYEARYHIFGFSVDTGDYTQLMVVAYHMPGDMAFRLLGPCLFSPYFPPLDHGDVMEDSPASGALSAVYALARDRLGEEIPKDIEGARRWWRENEQRFAIQPPVLKPPLGAAKSSPSSRQKLPEPTAHHLQTAPAAGARTAWWLVAVVALGLLAFLLFRRRD